MSDTVAFTLGVAACKDGKKSRDNPYSRKGEFDLFYEWMLGYAGQAKREADEALAAAR